MVYHIECLAEVEETQKRYIPTVVGGKDTVGLGQECGFARVIGTEAVLGRGGGGDCRTGSRRAAGVQHALQF